MIKPQRPRKPDATGRNTTSGKFVMLPVRILNSNAYRALTPNSRALLVELTMIFNGRNNGSLYLSVRDAAHRMGVSDLHAAMNALNELQALGFIEMTDDAHFRVKASEQSRARCWRLTWIAVERRVATCDFETREPEPQTAAHRRMERGLRMLKNFRKSLSQNRMPVKDSTTTGD